MRALVCWIGSFILTVIVLGLPTLTLLAFLCDWYSFFKFILTIATAVEVFGITDAIETNIE